MKMKVNKQYYKKQAVHNTGQAKLLTIPAKYAPDKKKVDVMVGQTEKGNTVMVVLLDGSEKNGERTERTAVSD